MKAVVRMGLILLGVAWMRPAVADTVGMASQITGKPQYQRASTNEWKPLHLLQKLEEGDKLKCATGESVTVIFFGNKGRYQLAANQSGTVAKDKVEGATMLAGLGKASADTVQTLAGARTGAFLSRAPIRFAEANLLDTAIPGWLKEGERQIKWNPELWYAPIFLKNNSLKYFSFSLFDTHGEVVYHVRSNQPGMTLPADVKLEKGAPYIWRVSGYFQTEKPGFVDKVHWGVLTWLSTKEIADMKTSADKLEKEIKADPTNMDIWLVKAEMYRKYGVLQQALYTLYTFKETLPFDNPASQPRQQVAEALRDMYQELGDFAQLFSGTAIGVDEKSGNNQD